MPETRGGIFKVHGHLKAAVGLLRRANDAAGLAPARAVVLEEKPGINGKAFRANYQRAMNAYIRSIGLHRALFRNFEMQGNSHADKHALASPAVDAVEGLFRVAL